MNISKIVLTIFGFVATIVGWGMWQDPQLNSNILITSLVNELNRLAGDPFSIIGLMIMLGGLWILFMLSGPWSLRLYDIFDSNQKHHERTD